ncbi:TPA: hypothetical protein AB5C39_003394 [Vibrio mimicus]|nr:hypothetical protein [Vibrio cholerae]EJL6307282.1 hypothetical protein [Vibrio cholerae]EJL6311014.1 hypothetical protein [Vibrio cholerae]EJL6419638.1 hypothetical protein [Vibrio cholerae]EJL6582267.1 hypothetical protein [Vibrio cholerae]
MHELEQLINGLREKKVGYDLGLQQAVQFTKSNNGTVENLEGGITRLTLNNFQVDCFRPYQDIDRFYFEY